MPQDGSAPRVVSRTSADIDYELAQALLVLDVALIVTTDAGEAERAVRLDGANYLIERAREHVAAAAGAGRAVQAA